MDVETGGEASSAERISTVCSENIHYIRNFHRRRRLAAGHERMEYHSVFSFLIPVLIALLQIHQQLQDRSPFISNPKRMWALVLTIIVYCFSFGIESSEMNHSQILAKIALISGSFCTATLLSLFLPQFDLWSSEPAVIVGKAIKEGFMWVYQMLRNIYANILGSVKRFSQRNCQEQSPSLALERVQVV